MRKIELVYFVGKGEEATAISLNLEQLGIITSSSVDKACSS